MQIINFIYILVSSAQLITLLFINFESFLSAIPIFLRINSLIIYIDIVVSLTSQKTQISKQNLEICLIYPFVLFTSVVSIWGIINSVLGLSFRMGFPLYTTGYDPHVFGPAMACSLVALCYIFF